MSKHKNFRVKAHPSIYKPMNRELELFVDYPDAGVNSDTGILLFIGGYGVIPEGTYFNKFRNYISEKHNCVVVQCNYFGFEQMPNSKEFLNVYHRVKDFLVEHKSKYIIDGKINQEIRDNLLRSNSQEVFGPNFFEIPQAFDEMGIMQSLDNITAVRAVVELLKKENLEYNENKTIVFGNSHGAYLAYLCNALAPGLFSLVIDSSAYLHPQIQSDKRLFQFKIDEIESVLSWPKLISILGYDSELADLEILYSNIDNHSKIVAFHGVDDKFLPSKNKRIFCEKIDNCHFNEVTEDIVDGKIFKSTAHGGAHYTRLFSHVLREFDVKFDGSHGELKDFIHQTSLYDYHINYSSAVPSFKAQPKTDKRIYRLSRLKIGV